MRSQRQTVLECPFFRCSGRPKIWRGNDQVPASCDSFTPSLTLDSVEYSTLGESSQSDVSETSAFNREPACVLVDRRRALLSSHAPRSDFSAFRDSRSHLCSNRAHNNNNVCCELDHEHGHEHDHKQRGRGHHVPHSRRLLFMRCVHFNVFLLSSLTTRRGGMDSDRGPLPRRLARKLHQCSRGELLLPNVRLPPALANLNFF
jgi:hypothetical protein